jgi:hypothetical protein
MTEASVTTGEDDEGWETLEDDLLDDDLDIEDGDMLIDPALLKPQANVAIVSSSVRRKIILCCLYVPTNKSMIFGKLPSILNKDLKP